MLSRVLTKKRLFNAVPLQALRSTQPTANNLCSRSVSSVTSTTFTARPNVRITHSNVPPESRHLFSEGFLKFLRGLSGEFQPRYSKVLKQRQEYEKSQSIPLELRPDLAWIRNDPTWRGPEVVPQLQRRWVEITGPASDPKMMINALNSGANCYMADLEDAQSPTWFGIVQGHQNLFEAVHGTLSYEKKEGLRGPSTAYTVNENAATLLVRARGVHMYEKHVVDEAGRPIPAGLFDIAMYMYHNAHSLISSGKRPLLYQPKLQTYEEAVLVHDVIEQAEHRLGIPHGTTRVTALIETLPGILQAEEIGFGLGAYWAGLNCGRWDHIFSVMKHSHANGECFPDRGLLGMTVPFLTQYMRRIVQVCHSRGVTAMGGMSALIPTKDAQETENVMKKVIADKEYEIQHGCDGAWVAHPGMVKSVQELFEKSLGSKDNQIDAKINLDAVIDPADYARAPEALKGVENYTEKGLRTNISVGVQYLGAWFDGQGAAAINGLMEDLATAEISRTQVWQWLQYKQQFTRADGSVGPLDSEVYRELFNDEVTKLKNAVEASSLTAREKSTKLTALSHAARTFDTLVTSKEMIPFIQDYGYEALNEGVQKPVPLRRNFKAMEFPAEEKAKLRGTRPDVTLDARLSILRGTDFNTKMAAIRPDGLVAHGNFIGTPNGHSARNVVEGGLEHSWPYIGGWELNARGLALGQPMPDTLAVNFHEQGDLAVVINRFLEVADRVQELEMMDQLEKIKNTVPPEQQDEAKIQLLAKKINYLTQPMLADLEQGWGDPKKVFLSVVRCLQNGVNIMHIEDQYSLKRCGHLGGKGLDDINGWVTTMKAANLAASIFDGVKRDGPNQNVNFVARTDALSAEFIQYSNSMHDPEHPDHFFIDWDRGFTPDGRYLYLKKGINEATGRKMGLEHSARRCAEIVRQGLASHVWMETPDANVSDARSFMRLVNEHLAPHGVFARGLYNHSPSFVWDVSFFIESQDIAAKVGDFIEREIQKPLDSGAVSLDWCRFKVREFLRLNGDRVRGDYNFEDDAINQILGNGLDLARGEVNWRAMVDQQMDQIEKLGPSLQTYKANKELNRILDNGYKPMRHITNVIVAQRLQNFKDRLSDAGFEVHLCTLPLYPSDAHTASELARGMAETGIHDFVINQRAARKYHDRTGNLTSFFHQKATGTGYEVAINTIVGTGNTDILAGSTEVADAQKEKSLRSQDTGPSTYRP